MADVQKEYGFASIARQILQSIAKVKMPLEQISCLIALLDYFYGVKTFRENQEAILSLNDFVQSTGMSKPNIHRALKALQENKVINVEIYDKERKIYRFQKDYDLWKYPFRQITPVVSTDNDSLAPEITPVVSTDKIHYICSKEVIKEDKRSSLPDFDFFKTWNDFAKKHSLAQINALTKGRKDKLNARLKESGFDFEKILEVLSVQDFAIGKVSGTDGRFWKVDFDWIIKNDTNYVKILEEKYRNTGKSDKHEVLSTQKKMEQEINEVRRLNGLDYINYKGQLVKGGFRNDPDFYEKTESEIEVRIKAIRAKYGQ